MPQINSSTVRVKAVVEDASNNALADDESDSDFTIDSTPPETTAILSGTQGENDWYTSDVTVSLAATDNLSDVKEIRFRIDNNPRQTYVEAFTVTGSTVRYYSEDNAGNIEPEKSIEIKIDKTAPATPAVTDDGEFTTDGSQLHTSWTSSDVESSIVEYQYVIGTAAGGSDVADWTSTGTGTEITKTGLSLTLGQTCYFAVKAKNAAGLWSSTGNSDGIVYQLPQIGLTPVNLAFDAKAGDVNPDAQTLSITNPSVGRLNWTITDDADWLTYTPASGDTTDETDEITVSVDIAGLDPGTYSAVITISSDNASNTPQTATVALNLVEPFSITLLTPNGGEKVKGGSFYNITWDAAGVGIDHIHLVYSTDSGASYRDIVASTADSGAYEWTTPQIDSSTVLVKAVAEDTSNNALADDESDAAFTIDSTPPETTATLSGTQGENDWYTSDVIVTLAAVDSLSDVKETRFRINTDLQQLYFSPFIIEGLTACYYYSEDNAGNIEAEKSLEIKVDKTPPETPVVTDDGEFTIDGSQLHASWASSDAESGVVEYQYAIGTTPDGDDVVGWRSAGADTGMTRAGLSLALGEMYYFAVKARNAAGLWSPIGSSDGIAVSGTRGDVNEDGNIRSNDAILTLRIAAGLITPTEYQQWAADMNDDGQVRSNDAIIILRRAAGLAAPGTGMIAYTGGRQITIALGETHGLAGENVTTPLEVDDIDGLAGGDICIAYDPTVLNAVDVSSAPGILLADDIAEPGMVQIAFAGIDGLNSRTLAEIRFDILADDVSPLALRSVELYSSEALPLISRCINREFTSWAIPPERSALLQNFPNPFNPETWIPYQLREGSEVNIRIYSIAGDLVRELDLGYRPAGLYVSQDRAAYWDGMNASGEEVASGIYFYSIYSDDLTAVRKLIVLR
jgi:hypothetical protein